MKQDLKTALKSIQDNMNKEVKKDFMEMFSLMSSKERHDFIELINDLYCLDCGEKNNECKCRWAA